MARSSRAASGPFFSPVQHRAQLTCRVVATPRLVRRVSARLLAHHLADAKDPLLQPLGLAVRVNAGLDQLQLGGQILEQLSVGLLLAVGVIVQLELFWVSMRLVRAR